MFRCPVSCVEIRRVSSRIQRGAMNARLGLSLSALYLLVTGVSPTLPAPATDPPEPARTVQKTPTQIAFGLNLDGNWDVYKVELDGSGLTRLTSGVEQERFPVWSPDGTKIIFGSQQVNRWELRIMDADGAHVMTL